MKKLSTMAFMIAVSFLIATQSLFAQSITYHWANASQRIYEQWVNQDSDCKSSSNASDNSGNVFYSGIFKGEVDFDPGVNAMDTFFLQTPGTYNNHREDGFVSKLNSNGELVWAQRLYSTNFQLWSGVKKVLTSNSDIYIFVEFFEDLKFTPLNTGITMTGGGNNNIAVIKMNTNGIITWSKGFGGQNATFYDASIDPSGNVLMVGRAGGPMTMNGTGTSISTFNDEHMFMIKLNSSGTLQWGKSNNIPVSVGFSFIDTDASGDVYISGTFDNYYSNIDADPGSGTAIISSNGATDIFALKLNSSGTFQWVKTIGTPFIDRVTEMEVNSNGNMIGSIWNASSGNPWDVDPGSGTHLIQSLNAALWCLNSSGSFQWATELGYDQVGGLSLDASDNVYVVANNSSIMTFSKFSSTGTIIVQPIFTNNIYGYSICVDNSNNIYITGTVFPGFDGDPTPGQWWVDGPGAFNVKWGQLFSTIQLVNASMTKNENDGFVTVNLSLSPAPANDQTVQIGIQDITTTVGSDYNVSPTNGTFTLTINAGSTSANFGINIIDDALVEGTESLTATINSVSGGLQVGGTTSMNFIILDNDSPIAIQEPARSEVSVYPNPSSGKVNIELDGPSDDVHVRIIGIDGKILMETELQSPGYHQIFLEADPGLYFLEMHGSQWPRTVVKVEKY